MRTNIFFIIACLLAIAAGQTYQLVWSDEFNGNSLDQSKWTIEQNCDGGGNNELQCYTNQPQNIAVRNGSLVITAIPQNYNGKQYTSGRINTKASAAWKYGRIDFNAKLPNGIYLWPALWMMPRDETYGWWAASGEIDIMESRSTQNTQESTCHFGGAWPNNIYQGSGPQTMSFDMTAGYHLYSAIWTPTQIQFLVDNSVYYTLSLQRNFWSGQGSNPYTANGQPFDQYFFIIINLAIGGNFFGGNANSLTTQQANAWANPQMFVDYVRVYQLSNNAVANNPTPSPTPAPTTSSTACTSMFAGLTCRTLSEDPTQISASSISGSRTWLCNNYPQFCTQISGSGTYASCNSAEQLSFAMDGYYKTFGPSQGSGACSFGGIGQIITQNQNSGSTTANSGASTTQNSGNSGASTTQNSATPATSASGSTTTCAQMFQQQQCRTASEDPTQVDSGKVSGARGWLCSSYPQYCVDINSGGKWASCNAVEQLSYSMNLYYQAVGPAQGASACSFGGIAALYSVSGNSAATTGNAAASSGNAAASTGNAAASSGNAAASTGNAAATTASSSSNVCSKASYCPTTLCACNGACYDPAQYCCLNNSLTWFTGCPK